MKLALDCGCGALQSILNAIPGQIKWDSSRLIALTTHTRVSARAFVRKTLNYIFMLLSTKPQTFAPVLHS